jgi:hypothetical protein
MHAINRSYAITSEIASYCPDTLGQPIRNAATLEALDKADMATGRGSVVHQRMVVANLIDKALSISHLIASRAQSPIEPRGRVYNLTRQTLALTAMAGDPCRLAFDRALYNCCLGAELMFAYGLNGHRSVKPARVNRNRNAALLLIDADDEPCAYQKAYGHPYAYAWRDSQMRTRAGLRQIPAGAILRPVYDQESNGPPPHEKYAGKGLVCILDSNIDDMVFMHFGIQVFPRALRQAALLDASSPDAYSHHRGQVAEAVDLDNAAFGREVMALMNDGLVYWPD